MVVKNLEKYTLIISFQEILPLESKQEGFDSAFLTIIAPLTPVYHFEGPNVSPSFKE